MSLTYQIILIGALMGVFAIVAGRVSSRLGAPVLLVFLGLGMLSGEDGLGIRYNDVSGAYFVCSVALAVILFDGGLRTQRSTIAVAGLPALVLATVGVAITAGIVAIAAWAMFGTPPAGCPADRRHRRLDRRRRRVLPAAPAEARYRGAALPPRSRWSPGLNDPMAIFPHPAGHHHDLDRRPVPDRWADHLHRADRRRARCSAGRAGGPWSSWVNRLEIARRALPGAGGHVGPDCLCRGAIARHLRLSRGLCRRFRAGQ